MRCIWIFGAAGFIGTELRKQLLIRGTHRLVSIDARPVQDLAAGALPADLESSAAARETRLQLDLGDTNAMEALVERREDLAECAGVIFLAAYYDFLNQSDERYAAVERGLDFTLRRLMPLMPEDAPFAFASSMAAMQATRPGEPLTPESPRFGGWAYPAHKLRCEGLLEAASKTGAFLQAAVELVLAGVYSDACELVPLYNTIELTRKFTAEKFLYPGPRKRGLTYVHVGECAEAFVCVLDADLAPGRVHRFLIGQDSALGYREIHAEAGRIFFGRPLPLFRIPKFVAWTGAVALQALAKLRNKRRFILPWMVRYAGEHFEFDLSRTRLELKWSPRQHLRADLPRILEFARDNPAEFRRINEARPF